MTAFLFAEPLAKMIEHAAHEWVRDALAEERLFSVFHPIVHARTGEVFAQEALLRARNPEDEQIIGAGQIIQSCEALNIQHQLDQRARQAALRGGAIYVPTPQRLFINFLPNTIYDSEICLRTMMETAATCGMPLSRIVFEWSKSRTYRIWTICVLSWTTSVNEVLAQPPTIWAQALPA